VSCAEARRLLAAYRRDDWSPAEVAALTLHLTTCAACRQAEAIYRQVGERVRQLPSITPPPELRARVFAAIQAEQRRVSPAVARLSRQETDPQLPVVRSLHAIDRPRRIQLGPRFALASAAIVALTLLTARVIPLVTSSSLGQTAASVAGVLPGAKSTAAPHVARYAVDAPYVAATSALATGAWLVYSATDAAGRDMLLAESRGTQKTMPLLPATTTTPIVVRALTDQWAIWSAGTGTASTGWTLSASRLGTSADAPITPITLLDSTALGADTPSTLGGVWASGDTVLVAAATSSGAGLLLRIDLASGTPVTAVIARAAHGHLLTDPSADNGAYYWADVWHDSATGLHSAIWRGDGTGQASEVSADETAFHPASTNGTLIWVEVPGQALALAAARDAGASADADEQTLKQLDGAVEARDLRSGQQWQVASRADVVSLQAAGLTVLWHSGTQTHTYDLAGKMPAPVEQQVRAATFAGATASAVVWAQGNGATLYISDVR
jgi:molybdopterin-guanine dinucleotide biosynthesis protein A